MGYDEIYEKYQEVSNEHINRPLFNHSTESVEETIEDIKKRLGLKPTGFSETICADDEIHATLTSSGYAFRAYDKSLLSDGDIRAISTFPQDYDFCGESPKYVCGMCVPPVMMAQIASQIYEQWFAMG